ncbi:uncharacterized protein [Salvelinus alpinus]|uniref:uncharacterized protein isoform X8 n=1 Tax=Salvelinus alpinus TaxID=8036 RepID=UPI0039FC430E
MSWWVCSLQEGPNCSSLATGELLLHYLKISAPLVEVLMSAVFGKSSLAAEVLLCWWSGKLSCCTPASPLALLFGQQGSGRSRWNWGKPGQVNSTQ